LLGIKLVNVEPGIVTLSLESKTELKRQNGILHGGAIASLIDTAAALAVLSTIGPDENMATVDLTIHYLRAIKEGTIKAEGKVLRAGRRVIAVSIEVMDEAGTLVATALSTYIRQNFSNV
jgi:uncharacterized protein (TIGR00369 family)